MPRELITERTSSDVVPQSGVLVDWIPGAELVQVGACLDVRPAPSEREYVFADLNSRRAVNDLIHQLRRARDAAWGKDE